MQTQHPFLPSFFALIAGLLFGIGLLLSGMTDPSKVLGFLDLAGLWNPSLAFVMGGAIADCGVTGRKIIVDTYGSAVPHGGGAFSGKDPTKVDRSAAYMARYIAKQLVHQKIVSEAMVVLAYAIGSPEPVLVQMIDERGQERGDYVRKHFDTTPQSIIDTLDLYRPIYQQTASFGHFGRLDLDLPWERFMQGHD